MNTKHITQNIHWVGAIDWDRRIFDDIIPIPDGTSYNSYIVKGTEKVALIDTVEPAFTNVLLERLDRLGITRLDYVIANHAEQDHSGSIPTVLKRFPDAKVVCTPKALQLLGDLVGLTADRTKTVEDGATLDLGGTTLKFIHFPWVHWPETMLTWHEQAEVLFPCDLYGSHWATSELQTPNLAKLRESAELYFSTIMAPYRNIIEKNLPKVEALKPKLIAPSHGPVHANPEMIMSAYREWLSAPPENLVLIPYASMHGSTQMMVRHLADALIHRGVAVEVVNVTNTSLGKLAIILNRAATVIFGSPVVLAGAHPAIANAAFVANVLRPKAKFAGVIGSYSWGGKIVDQLAGLMPNLKVEMLETVQTKGEPRPADLAALEKLADTIANKHKEILAK